MATLQRTRASNPTLDSTVDDLENRRYKPARETRRMFEQDWILQIAFTLGHQWVSVDPSGRVYGGDIDDRVMLTDNRIRPAVRMSIAKQTKTTPTWVGIPRGTSDEEIQRARMRSIVFEHYWRELDARRKFRLALWYREVTGSGFLKQTWDQSLGGHTTVMAVKGGPVLTDSYGGPITPDRARQQIPEGQRSTLDLEERKVTFGDACLDVVTPFELAVDPLATDEGMKTAEYVVQDGIFSPANLARRFGADPDKLEEDASPSAGILEGRFPAFSSYLGRQRDNRGAAGRRGCRTREYWSIPGVDGPRGKHCVWTLGGELLLEEDNPYPWLPYPMFSGPPSGRFYADAPIKDAISPQTELNKTTSQIAENMERFGNPARLRSSESLDQDADWQGLPGEEIIYRVVTGGQADIPSFLAPPEMPVYAQNRPAQIIESLNSTLNYTQVQQGNVPAGVTAASAINMLLEASDTTLGDDIKEAMSGLLDVGKMLLWQVRQFAHDDRLATIAGEDSSYDVYSFTGEALGDCGSDEVDIGSEQSQSVAAKQAGIQFVLNLLIQNGQAPPPRELRRILRDYEVGGLEHMFASVSRDQTQVIDEHRRMLRGEPVPINDFDDDSIHIAEHDDFRKGGRYRDLQKTPGGQRVQAIIDAHVMMHKQRAQAAATQQVVAGAAANALQTGGSPGPDPTAVSSAPVEASGGGTPPGALPSPQPSPGG
jgi:hypothetical protein